MAQSIPPVVQDDPYLKPYEKNILLRQDHFRRLSGFLKREYGSLSNFASAYTYLGLNYDPERQGWWYREWAPAASQLFLIGDFNGWNRTRHPLHKTERGVWEIFLPDAEYQDRFVHKSRVKVHVVAANGAWDRMPAYIRSIAHNPATKDFAGQVWNPPEPFQWTDAGKVTLPLPAPLVYEAHPGMAQEKEAVGTYREFADHILPRIQAGGYNSIQLMAVMAHPYYGSFGYHVSSFFAPSEWFGAPDDLKYLVDQAHNRGLAVIMDLVHSHSVKNLYEGLNDFDGSGHQYFLPGKRGEHPQWDSKLFDYAKMEVLQFLLSNLRYWIEEFHFDGFRFDGVTSMLYTHHGLNVAFDHYDKYFGEAADPDALAYLQLANELTHEIKPGALTVAEDMSGMPGMCRAIPEGGIGFDYRLGMGIPDYWIKLVKHVPDERWNIQEIWHVLTDRRWKEKTIAYAESHDQALVGDKTLAFWLMDKEMYDKMGVDIPSIIVDRGMALHKMIRLITLSLGGEGYLNFMGNEFGHPEWVDFPREGNRWSFKHARRQWSLLDNEGLKYQYLAAFDRAMIRFAKEEQVLQSLPARQLYMDVENQILVAERNNLIFVFNFHPDRSREDYRFPVPRSGDYRIILNSDARQFGGFGRVDDERPHWTLNEGGENRLSLYVTNRTALVLKKI
jgi:1,4-alpha-glucan branching enzyme